MNIPVCAAVVAGWAAVARGAFGEDVSAARLMEVLRELPTQRAALGGAADAEGLSRTEELVVTRLRELGYEPVLEAIEWAVPARRWGGENQPQEPDKNGGNADGGPASQGEDEQGAAPARWHNIVVEIPGRTVPHEVLLVGAHMDAAPRAPGADDNGTGVAALLEIARVMKDRPVGRTVRLVFFNLEEAGLIGSRQFAERWRDRTAAQDEKDRETIVGMLSLEMLGFYSDEPNSQKSPIKEIKGVFTPPTVGDFIALVTVAAHRGFNAKLADAMTAAAPGLKVGRIDFLPVAVPDMLRSDHAPFLALGVPAVMVTDTANFRNPNYHKPTDTVETIDGERFTLTVKGLAGAIEALATQR